MKKGIRIILATSLILTSVFSMVLYSCSDPCTGVICKNNGICRDGACACGIGFEGPFCEDAMNKKFIGTWDGSYRCNGNAPTARTFIMSPKPNPFEVLIYDLFAQNEQMEATVDGVNITIPFQTINNWEYRGYGTVEGKYITMYIEQRDPLNNFNSCVYNATKYQD